MTTRNSCKLMWAGLLLALAATSIFAQPPQEAQTSTPASPATGASSAPEAPPAPKEHTAKPAAATAKAEEFPLDKVVLKVGGEQATAADVEFAAHFMPHEIQGELLTEGRIPMGEQYLRMMTLSQEAARQHLDDSPDLRRRMALTRMQWLAKAEFKNLEDQVKVTQDEIKEHYDTHKSDYAEVWVRYASVRKKQPNLAAPGLSEEEARAKADAIRKAIESGADFAKVAEQFKMPGVTYFDLQPRAMHHGQLPANVDREVFSLKDGELSQTTDDPQVVSFMLVVKHTQPDLKDVQAEIETQLRNQRLSDSIKSLEKRASVWMDPLYFAPVSGSSEESAKGKGADEDRKP